MIRYITAENLHDELRQLHHDRSLSRGVLAALVDAYRHTGLDEYSIRQWAKANRHNAERSVGWIPQRAQVFRNRTHVLILTPPASIEVLERDLAA